MHSKCLFQLKASTYVISTDTNVLIKTEKNSFDPKWFMQFYAYILQAIQLTISVSTLYLCKDRVLQDVCLKICVYWIISFSNDIALSSWEFLFTQFFFSFWSLLVNLSFDRCLLCVMRPVDARKKSQSLFTLNCSVVFREKHCCFLLMKINRHIIVKRQWDNGICFHSLINDGKQTKSLITMTVGVIV